MTYFCIVKNNIFFNFFLWSFLFVCLVLQQVTNFSCRRKKCRWPMALFHNIIDVSAVNAFILWAAVSRRRQMDCFHRRHFLEELGMAPTLPLTTGHKTASPPAARLCCHVCTSPKQRHYSWQWPTHQGQQQKEAVQPLPSCQKKNGKNHLPKVWKPHLQGAHHGHLWHLYSFCVNWTHTHTHAHTLFRVIKIKITPHSASILVLICSK